MRTGTDHRLVELAFSLPAEVKVRHGQGKWVLKEVARRHIPAEIVDRRKIGFRVPLDAWFRGPLRPMVEQVLMGPDSWVCDLMDRNTVRTLVDDHTSGRRNEQQRIWTLMCLETWHTATFRSPLQLGRRPDVRVDLTAGPTVSPIRESSAGA